MASGNLVSDTLVMDAFSRRVSEPDCSRGLILDGFPRTLSQAEFLERGLQLPSCSANLSDNIIAIQLRVQLSTIVRRLSGRRVCFRCGATYHLETQPPQVSGECDFDGSALGIRADDRQGTVLKRLRLYEQETAPVIRHYADKGSLFEVDGEQSTENVTQEILTAIHSIFPISIADPKKAQSRLEDNA
jgi:adenylate kinase